jgi:hypothetical protein
MEVEYVLGKVNANASIWDWHSSNLVMETTIETAGGQSKLDWAECGLKNAHSVILVIFHAHSGGGG